MKRPVIAIEKGEKVFIPRKYRRIHNLCAIIYDQLTEIYKNDNYKSLQFSAFEFKDGDVDIEKLKEESIHALDWLKNNNRNEEIELVLTKHIVLALVSDFINFIFESMHCAKRGKLTVAYALLRKPLTDELLLLEQILSNRTDFINKLFHSGNPEDYDPSNKNVDKLKIIKNALTKLDVPFFQDYEFIHELRYDKASDMGINGITNHALHIVTKDRNYRTEEQNLNFIFSQKDDMERYYWQYYFVVPYLLIYAVCIIDKILFSILTDDDNQCLSIVKHFRRYVGFVLFTEYRSGKRINGVFKTISNGVNLTCPKCKNHLTINRADYILFFETELIVCPNCLINILNKENVKVIGNAIGMV
jgi:DNA-directed RNA polymerase subunit RPC12/RpoP